MARSYGKILASLVTDDEFNDLSGDEQALYLRLLGHPTLSLVGRLEYRPNHWAAYSRGWDRSAVEALVCALEARRYVAVDRDTEELLIRTLTRHDGIPHANPKLRKGLWAQWAAIASPMLRRVAVENMPNELLNAGDVPDAALKIARTKAPEHPTESLPDWAIPEGTGWVPDSPASYHLPPVTSTTAPESAPEPTRSDPQLVGNALADARSHFGSSS